jgi:hypothetical protein
LIYAQQHHLPKQRAQLSLPSSNQVHGTPESRRPRGWRPRPCRERRVRLRFLSFALRCGRRSVAGQLSRLSECHSLVSRPGAHRASHGHLLTNALRHTPTGGTVTVASRPGDRWVELIVEDSGEEIEPEHVTQVFDRFYRADTSRNLASRWQRHRPDHLQSDRRNPQGPNLRRQRRPRNRYHLHRPPARTPRCQRFRHPPGRRPRGTDRPIRKRLAPWVILIVVHRPRQ